MSSPKGETLPREARLRLFDLPTPEDVTEFSARIGVSEQTVLRAIAGYRVIPGLRRIIMDAIRTLPAGGR